MLRKACCSVERRMPGCRETAEVSTEESDAYQNIQRAAWSVRPDPGLKHLEGWGWTESSPWPGPCEALVLALLSDGGVCNRDSLSSHDPYHHIESIVSLWAPCPPP